MIEYRIAEVPNSKISKPYQNINYSAIEIHPINQSRNRTLRQKALLPNLKSLTSTTTIPHETKYPHSKEQNQNNHSRNKITQASDFNLSFLPLRRVLGFIVYFFINLPCFIVYFFIYVVYVFSNNKIKVS